MEVGKQIERLDSIEARGQPKIRLFPCAHCKGTGTCTTGQGECSCGACARAASEKRGSVGLRCSVCNGVGVAELGSDSFRRTIVPALALLIVVIGFGVIVFAAVANNPHFTEMLAFCSSIIGVVTGYYFAGKQGSL